MDSNGVEAAHAEVLAVARKGVKGITKRFERLAKGAFADLGALGFEPNMAFEGHEFQTWHEKVGDLQQVRHHCQIKKSLCWQMSQSCRAAFWGAQIARLGQVLLGGRQLGNHMPQMWILYHELFGQAKRAL